jgi:hypothetical protein
MLAAVLASGEVSDRRLRLFIWACLRQVPLPDGRAPSQSFPDGFRLALDTAERLADKVATEEKRACASATASVIGYRAEERILVAPYTVAEEAFESGDLSESEAQRYWYRPPTAHRLASASLFAASELLLVAVCPDIRSQFPNSDGRIAWEFRSAWLHDANRTANDAHCIDLMRDLFGPFPLRPIFIDPAVLDWNNGMVSAIARRIYDERAFYDLPVLADALRNAGCSDPDILSHCRQPGDHVRGCWVVDLALGNQ